MVTLIRMVRVLLLLVLAFLSVSFIVGMARPETGAVEKLVLLMFIVGCVAAAARISSLALAIEGRLHRH